MIEPGSGTLYILNDDEVPKKFGEVKDVEMQMTPEVPPELVVPVTGLEATAEMCCKIGKELIITSLDIRYYVLDLCPNKRVVHLAKHGKKRTRKKNFNRAIRNLEGCKWPTH